MKKRLVRVALIALAVVGAWAAVAFPHLNRVETGKTPEYADLQPREYAAPPPQVSKAVLAALGEMPGWSYTGSGSGPGGSQTQATSSLPPCDMFVWVRGGKGKTTVSVKSESRYGPWDFGQNARNIRAFLARLDQQLQ
jgi:hypothetical protein